MLRIKARSLLEFSTDQLWDILTGTFVLVFDDNEEVETNYRETLYSSYFWNFHREYPYTPLLKIHHVKEVIGNKRLSSNTHLTLLGNCMWTVYDTYLPSVVQSGMEEIDFRDILARRVYQLTNELYNALIIRLEEYVTSLDIKDFMEVINYDPIRIANETVEPNEKSITLTQDIIKTALLTNAGLDNNPLALASRAGLVSMGQVLQCVGPRGYLTDINSNIFPVPILRGYAHGIRSLEDSIKESRSAAKSLIFSKQPLQQAEYFSRRLQLMTQPLRNLHYGDCGSTRYLNWRIRPDTPSKKGDLKRLVGKNYVDSNGNIKTIKASDKHLIGEVVKLRSPLFCAHEDPYGFCSTCYGELSLSVPRGTNIGQMNCSSLAQKSSQLVMSVKHYDGSSVVDSITLIEEYKNYLRVSNDGNSYLLSEKIKDLKPVLVIEGSKANNLTDVMEVSDVRDLNITRVSEFDEIGIMFMTKENNEPLVLQVSLNKRLASITYELLNYIKKVGWSIDKKANYLIDLSGWDYSKEILTLPLRHFSMSDHSQDVAKQLESSVEDLRKRDKSVTLSAALLELFDLINDKLDVNLAVIETVFLASTVVSIENKDYSFPKANTTGETGVMRLSMGNRSLSAMMAYEGHRDSLIDPNSFMLTNRLDHPMDKLFVYTKD